MKSRSSSLTSGFLIVIVVVAGMTLIMPVSADNIQTVVVPDTAMTRPVPLSPALVITALAGAGLLIPRTRMVKK